MEDSEYADGKLIKEDAEKRFGKWRKIGYSLVALALGVLVPTNASLYRWAGGDELKLRVNENIPLWRIEAGFTEDIYFFYSFPNEDNFFDVRYIPNRDELLSDEEKSSITDRFRVKFGRGSERANGEESIVSGW